MKSIRLSSRLNLFLFVSISALASACSMRSQETDLSINMPNWNQMRADDMARASKVSSQSVDDAQLTMVVVNVSGGDLKTPVFWSWENHDDAAANPPAVISLQLAKGSGRLVQVLGVFEGEGGMQFYYGSQAGVSMTTDTVPLTISISNVATSTNLEGRVVGRYLTTATSGPTGSFQYRFLPPEGGSSMVIHHGEIFGGWMDVFTLSSQFIHYSFPGGQPVFDALSMTNSNPALHSASVNERTVAIRVPSGYARRYRNSAYTFSPRAERRVVVGFFGPGAGTQGVCVPDMSVVDLRDFYSEQDDDASYAIAFNYSESTLSANRTLVESNPHSGVKGGHGVSGWPMSCAADVGSAILGRSGTLWTEVLVLEAEGLGDESPLAMKGPYAGVGYDSYDGRPKMMSMVWDDVSATMQVAWDYLPDSGISTSGVFWRFVDNPQSDSDVRQNDGYKCNSLVSMGFNHVDVSSSAETYAIPATEANLDRLQVVVCPKDLATGAYYTSAIRGVGRRPLGTLGFKIVGNDDAISDVWNKAMLPSSGTKLSSKLIVDPFFAIGTQFAAVVDGTPLEFGTEVLKIEASLDNATWVDNTTPVTLGQGSTNLVTYSGDNIEAALLVSAETDPVIYLRMTLEPNFAAQNSLPETKTITFQALTSRCANPSTPELVDLTGGTYTSANLLADVLGQPNTTDIERTYRLKYPESDCEDVKVPIDWVAYQPPSNRCWGSDDVRRDESDPFGIVASPSDPLGVDCTTDDMSLEIYQTSDGQLDGQTRVWGVTGDWSYHSTVAAKVAPYLWESGEVTPLNDLSTKTAVVKYLLSGPGNSFRFYAAAMNSDGQPVSRGGGSIYSSANVFWNDASNIASLWSGGLPSTGVNPVDLMVGSSGLSPLSSAAYSRFVINSTTAAGLTGGFDILATSTTDEVVETGSLWGMPVVLTRNGTNVRVFIHWRDMTTAYEATLREITPAGGITLASVSSRVRFQAVQDPANPSAASFVISHDTKMYYGTVTSQNGFSHFYAAGTPFDVASSGAAYTKILGVFENVSWRPRVFVVVESAGDGVYMIDDTGPVFTGMGVAGPDTSLFATGNHFVYSSRPGETAIDAVRCHPDEPGIYAVLKTADPYARIVRLDEFATETEVAPGSNITIDVNHDRVACATTYSAVSHDWDGTKSFLFTNSSDVGAPIMPVVISTDYEFDNCGAGGGFALLTNANLNVGVGTTAARFGVGGEFYHPISGGAAGFIFNSGRNAAADPLKFAHVSGCTAGILNWSVANQPVTKLPSNTGQEFTGITTSQGFDSSTTIDVFGKNGQLLKFEMR